METLRLNFVVVFLVFVFSLSFLSSGSAQSPEISGPIVMQPVKMGISPPVRDLPKVSESENVPQQVRPLLTPFKRPASDAEDQGNIQRDAGKILSKGITKNFDGVSASGYAPPDPSGDVGPNHYVEMVNVRTQIWDKNGTTLAGPFNNIDFWSGLPGPWSGTNDGDAIVLYDDMADRWLISQFALPNYPNGPFYMLIAISSTPDPTGTYYQYVYSYTDMPDYPKFGVWQDAYYMSANVFASGTGIYSGVYAVAFDRAAMLAGSPATSIQFNLSSETWSLLPSDCDGTAPPAGSPNYFLATYNSSLIGNTNLDIYEFDPDFVTPGNSTFNGPTFLSTQLFNYVNGIPQLGTGNLLDDLSDRPMNRLQYRNFGTHQSMVVCQTVNAGSGRAGMRWWELRKTSGAWSIYQEGTYAPADGLFRWMGSIAMNSNGDIAMGYSVSSTGIYPEIRYTGRLAGDPLGIMTIAENNIHSGSGSQTGTLHRWGDYTQMAVDPAEPNTFWYTNQYQPADGTFNWKTRIAAFSLDGGAGTQSQYLVWEGTLGGQDYSGAYINSYLTGLGYTVDYTSSFPSSLMGYNAVFLSFGNYGSGNTVFNSTMAATVQAYLEAGGKVYLEGGDALEFDQATNTTLHDLFGLGDGADGSNNIIDGLQGQTAALTEGMLFTSSAQTANSWIDTYVLTSGTLAFVESGYGNVAVQYSGSYGQKTFCFSYALAKLNDGTSPSSRSELLNKILFFFTQQPDISVSPVSLSFSINPGVISSDYFTILNQGNAALEWNIYEQSTSAILKMKDGKVLEVKIQPKFEWKQPVRGEVDLPPVPSIRIKPEYPAADVYLLSKSEYLSIPANAGAECSGGLIYDDGTVENGYGWNGPPVIDGIIVSRFDPPSYPYNFGKVCITWTRVSTDAEINYNIIVYDDDGAGGAPGTILASIPATSTGIPMWPAFTFYDNDVTGLIPEIGSGSVYIGVRWNPTAEQLFYICADETPINPVHPGYAYNDADGSWYTINHYFGSYRSMFIRAERSSDDIQWITENPVSGTIPAGSYQAVIVSVDATGLAMGTYNCDLVISSNDPNEPEVFLPVTLNVIQADFLVWEGGLGVQDYSGAFISSYLTNLGHSVEYTSVFPASLLGYEAVFLSFGNYNSNYVVFDGTKASTVQAYLETGGKVYLEGGDALEYDQGSNAALHSLFGIGDGSDGGTNVIDGLNGQIGSLTEWMMFTSSTQVGNGYIDIYVPTTGTLAFNESGYGNTAVQHIGIYGQKTFCFSYALACLTDGSFPTTKNQVMKKILEFFTSDYIPPEISTSPASLTFTAAVSGSASEALTINNEGGSTLWWNISEQSTVKNFKLEMPDGKELPINIERKTEWKQPVKGEDFVPPPPSVTSVPFEFFKNIRDKNDLSENILKVGNSAYSTDVAHSQFVQFDLEQPEYLNNVSSITSAIYVGDFGTDPTFAYAITYTTNLFIIIDKLSGAVTVIGTSVPQHNLEVFTGMAVDLNTGILYLTGSDINTSWLYTVNTSTGALTLIGTITNAPAIIATAIDNAGQMYGYDIVNDVMLRIDKTTCVGTVLGPLGFNANFGQGMDFDPATGTLYLSAVNAYPLRGELRIGNIITGNTYLIGEIGYAAPGSMAQLGWLGIPGQIFDCTWLTENPLSDSIPGGGNQVVTVSIDATGLTPGSYNCNLVIISNDPDEPQTVVPVTLDVIGLPDINVTPSLLTFTVPEGSTDTKVINISNTAPSGYEDLNWMIYESSVKDNLVLKMNDGPEIPVKLQDKQSTIISSMDNLPLKSTPKGGQAPASPVKMSVLYDQTGNPSGNSTNVQNFETAYDAYDCFGADDFEVTGGGWLIESVDLTGIYFSGSGPASSVNVWFYSDIAGLPGDPIYSALYLVPTSGLSTGSFAVTLPYQAVLSNGHYWLVIQTNMNFDLGGQWGWTESTVQSDTAAVWKNPGGGFGTPCTNWGHKVTDCGVGAYYDYCFRLNGSVYTGINWITENPSSGTVAPGNNQNVDITVDATSLTAGTYNCNLIIGNNDPDENPITIPVTLNVTPAIVTDFTANFLVQDNCINSQNLIFGTAPTATECYDAGLDIYAPPPPPAGAFGGWFQSCGENLLRDYKQTNTNSARTWDVYYQSAAGCSPVSFTWNPAELPVDGNFHLRDAVTGTIVNVDMRTASTYTDASGLGHLQIVFNYEVAAQYNITQNWNMISLPLNVSNANYLTLFPHAVPGTLFGFNGTYYTTTTIETCTGYWLRFPAAETVTVQGVEITGCAIGLNTGWNMIGGPNCNVASGSISDPGNIIIPGTLFGFNGSYYSATSVDATKGYWIRANAPGIININCSTMLAKEGRDLSLPANIFEQFSKIEIHDAVKNNQTLYFNGKLDETITIESFSLPPVAPAGSFDVRLPGGYRLTESDEASINVQAFNYPLSIKTINLKPEDGYAYVLKEMMGNESLHEYTLTEGTEILLNNKEVSLLVIFKQRLIPAVFSLAQNYPNPFNPSTVIKYALPEQRDVSLIIYNSLGEKVKTLVSGIMEAGYYNVTWDGTNDYGKSVGSGMYIYALRAGDYNSVKKMLFVK